MLYERKISKKQKNYVCSKQEHRTQRIWRSKPGAFYTGEQQNCVHNYSKNAKAHSNLQIHAVGITLLKGSGFEKVSYFVSHFLIHFIQNQHPPPLVLKPHGAGYTPFAI